MQEDYVMSRKGTSHQHQGGKDGEKKKKTEETGDDDRGAKAADRTSQRTATAGLLTLTLPTYLRTCTSMRSQHT